MQFQEHRKQLFKLGIARGWLCEAEVRELEERLKPYEREILRISLRGCGVRILSSEEVAIMAEKAG